MTLNGVHTSPWFSMWPVVNLPH